MKKKYQLNLGLIICGLLLAGNAIAARGLSDLNEKQRIERLERLINSDVLHKQTQDMQILRDEISQLRGQIEQQEYELESMKQRQRNLYIDMDRRLIHVEAGGRNNANVVSPVPPPRTKTSNSSIPALITGDSDVQAAYSKAFGLLKEGQYKQAISAFEAFKKNHPNSKYAENAQYWLGETRYASREYKKALKEFQQLIARYPNSSKSPAARLKIGYVYFELKNWSAARDALKKTIALYPDTTVAKKANERLQRIKREGH